MKRKSPIKDLVRALEEDPGYREGWVANIAMAFYDNYCWHMKNKHSAPSRKDIHAVGNKAAKYFLELLCRDTTSSE
jgi:hypothetical protein